MRGSSAALKLKAEPLDISGSLGPAAGSWLEATCAKMATDDNSDAPRLLTPRKAEGSVRLTPRLAEGSALLTPRKVEGSVARPTHGD